MTGQSNGWPVAHEALMCSPSAPVQPLLLPLLLLLQQLESLE